MRRSWLRYLGVLGFLGLLGLATPNKGFVGFFGFFGFLAFSGLPDDERLQINVCRSARNAFVSSVLAFALFAVYGALAPDVTQFAYALGFGLSFGLQMLIFSLSLVYYER